MKIYPRWHGEPIARTLRRLQKALERDGWPRDVKRHAYAQTEAQRRRRERGRKKTIKPAQ